MPIPAQCTREDCIREVFRNDLCRHHYLTGLAQKSTEHWGVDAPADAPAAPAPPTPAVTRRTASPAAAAWEWQRWDTTLARMRGAPTMTVNRAGHIAVSASADVLIGTPEYVDLYYSPRPQGIGFKAGTAKEGLKVSRNKGVPGFTLGAARFFEQYGIDYSETRLWRAQLIDGVLAINLEDAPLRPMGRKAGVA